MSNLNDELSARLVGNRPQQAQHGEASTPLEMPSAMIDARHLQAMINVALYDGQRAGVEQTLAEMGSHQAVQTAYARREVAAETLDFVAGKIRETLDEFIALLADKPRMTRMELVERLADGLEPLSVGLRETANDVRAGRVDV